MNINYYEIKFKKYDNIELKNYMALFRYLLYYSQENIAPQKIVFQPELLQILDGEVFAHRLGLVMFRSKSNSVMPCSHKFEIKNPTDKILPIYSGELSNDEIEPINKSQLIMKLPPNFPSTTITIDFDKGRGTEHARYSIIEGYAMDANDNCTIKFELNDDTIDQTIKNYKDLVESELSNLESENNKA